MIEWFTYAQVAVAVVVGLYCVVRGLAKGSPNDFAILSLALVELLLFAQLVIAVVAPSVGNSPTGNVIEFYAYLVTALLIPPLALVWALIERNRWSTVVLGVAALAIAVMVYRMQQIWAVQLA